MQLGYLGQHFPPKNIRGLIRFISLEDKHIHDPFNSKRNDQIGDPWPFTIGKLSLMIWLVGQC